MENPLKRSILLYKYDPRNKTNFHQYIDNIKSLCLIVKTPFAIIAGYYPGIFEAKGIMNKGGLLVSVTNDESYKLKVKPGDNVSRGMTYDNFFVIFGNSELRIKHGDQKLYSNFGLSNAYYDNRGHKVNDFLNEGDKR